MLLMKAQTALGQHDISRAIKLLVQFRLNQSVRAVKCSNEFIIDFSIVVSQEQATFLHPVPTPGPPVPPFVPYIHQPIPIPSGGIGRSGSAPSILLANTTPSAGPSFPVPHPPYFQRDQLSPAVSFPSSVGSSPLSIIESPNLTALPPGPRKRRRDRTQSRPGEHLVTPFSQGLFETYIARITASAGLPLRWVENPQWLNFLSIFLPQAVPVSRKVLTKRLLPEQHRQYLSQVIDNIRGLDVTLQCDGWSGLNTHHYIAFRVTTAVNRDVSSLR